MPVLSLLLANPLICAAHGGTMRVPFWRTTASVCCSPGWAQGCGFRGICVRPYCKQQVFFSKWSGFSHLK